MGREGGEVMTEFLLVTSLYLWAAGGLLIALNYRSQARGKIAEAWVLGIFWPLIVPASAIMAMGQMVKIEIDLKEP